MSISRKSYVKERRFQCSSECAEPRGFYSCGSEFHSLGPAPLEVLSPALTSCRLWISSPTVLVEHSCSRGPWSWRERRPLGSQSQSHEEFEYQDRELEWSFVFLGRQGREQSPGLMCSQRSVRLSRQEGIFPSLLSGLLPSPLSPHRAPVSLSLSVSLCVQHFPLRTQQTSAQGAARVAQFRHRTKSP